MKALNEDLQMRSDWNLPLCTGRERLRQNGVKAHPTQKPESLLYRVISASTNSGDVVLDPFFGTGTTGMVAARLRRHYIGMERDERYVRLARQRLETVQLEEVEPEVFHQANPPRPPRLPFGALLETGLVQPGQRLVFGSKAQAAATVLPNGHLSCQGQTGSIHQMARMLANAPCNGWEHWYVVDEATGRLTALGRLRDDALRLEAQRQAGQLSDVVI
jgi:modification methylase